MDESPPSEVDYAVRVASENNIEMSASESLTSSSNNAQSFNFTLPPSQLPRAANEAISNPASNGHTSVSTELPPPTVIPYSANVPADPSLWDGNFTATSLFGTDEFLNSDIRNITCSLQRMARFLRQRNLEGCNGNNMSQLSTFGESAWEFISAIFESGWDQLTTSDDTPIRDNIMTKFSKVNIPPAKGGDPNNCTVKKVPPPIPPRLSKKELEKARITLRNAAGKTKNSSPLSYAQATSSASNILKIKEAFPALPNKRILEIHNATFPTLNNKGKKIQPTTKGPSRKQAIVPVSSNLTDSIMEDANNHIFQINSHLKNIKSTLRAEFIRPCPGSISIITNNVPNPSDLTIMEKHFKSIEGIDTNEVLAPHLPQSKSYLKITGIPYLCSDGNKISSDNVTDFMKHIELFENISLAAKPRIIRASPKSDIAIIWFDIWDTQNGSKAKLLINHSFNLGRHIATIRATNMNPGIPQCHNCWKWGHSTFSCRVHSSKCQKCSGPHKLEHHRDLAGCCKANPKLNPPCLETAKGLPCSHSFKCINCKGDHMADDYKCPFWRNCFNRNWHSKKAQEAWETRANSICLAVGSKKL